MRILLIITVFSVFSVFWAVNGEHLVVGNVNNRVVMVHQEQVRYNLIPFIKRVKNYFYSSPQNRIIQGIQALDNAHSKASVVITAGGVNKTFVNLRFKSERSGGLDYDVGIYMFPEYINGIGVRK